MMTLLETDFTGKAIQDIRIGTDLLYMPRLEKISHRIGNRFFQRVLTEAEWLYCQQGHSKHLLRRAAARIAVKEAVAKALGCGLNGLGWGNGVNWQDIELLSQEKEAPVLQLHRTAQEKEALLSVQDWRVSISHDGDYALATVVGLIL
jgi:holo-[acyl-carrier protein] synthase